MQVLLFKVNEAEYGILLKDVEFISEKRNVVKMPNEPESVRGIVMLRGKAVPVYSLASRFGFVEQENRYLLVVKVDNIKIALEVSEIDKVVWAKKEAVVLLPVMVRAAQMCFKEALIYGEKLIGLLDISRLVPQFEKLQMDMEKFLQSYKND